VFCDFALVYVRDLVAFGFLTEGLFLVSTLLDTEERVLVTFSRVFLSGVTLLERVDVALSETRLALVLVVAFVLRVVLVEAELF
jgi:hypothetical protein